MNRRALALLAIAALLLGVLYFAWSSKQAPQTSPLAPPTTDQRRIASLSPAITDTIVALGAKDSLVLVSDYCKLSDRPRAGTIISPRFEAIAAAEPDLIVATTAAGTPDSDLRRLAPLLALPWLDLEEVTTSIRRVGTAVDRAAEAALLAQRMADELRPRAAPDAPKVLLLMGPLADAGAGYFYIRDDSLHGRLLTASGYQNAMGRDASVGQPHLSVEALLRVDPDAVLVLQETAVTKEQPLSDLTPLQAVRGHRTGVLSRAGILSMGPEILEVRRLVQAAIDRLLQASERREGAVQP